MYLKAQINGKREIDHNEISFYLKGVYITVFIPFHFKLLVIEKRLVHSQLSATIMEDSVASLLTISPNHGRVEYYWEKRTYSNEWKRLEVPPWTCLLYVTIPSQYRCTVEQSTVEFDVKGNAF